LQIDSWRLIVRGSNRGTNPGHAMYHYLCGPFP
jgi:hypothetical protein